MNDSLNDKTLDTFPKLLQSHVRLRPDQEAIREKLRRIDRNRLARECAKLDLNSEQKMAEEGKVSEVALRRSEYASVLKSGGIEKLIVVVGEKAENRAK